MHLRVEWQLRAGAGTRWDWEPNLPPPSSQQLKAPSSTAYSPTLVIRSAVKFTLDRRGVLLRLLSAGDVNPHPGPTPFQSAPIVFGTQSEVTSVAIGQELVLGACSTGVVNLWQAEVLQPDTPRVPGSHTVHQGPVQAMSCSPVQAQAASASGGAVKLWDMETGAELASLSLPSPAVSLDFSQDGRSISCSYGSKLLMWDTTNNKTCTEDVLTEITASSLSDTGLVAAGDSDGLVMVWDPRARGLDTRVCLNNNFMDLF